MTTITKLSPKNLGLHDSYRTTACARAHIEPLAGRNRTVEIARFHSSTPGHVEVFASQSEDGAVTEISESEFFRLLTEGKIATLLETLKFSTAVLNALGGPTAQERRLANERIAAALAKF